MSCSRAKELCRALSATDEYFESQERKHNLLRKLYVLLTIKNYIRIEPLVTYNVINLMSVKTMT